MADSQFPDNDEHESFKNGRKKRKTLEEKRKANRERQKKCRLKKTNEEKEVERLKNTLARKKRRENVDYRNKEREADASARRSRRENPDLRVDEQVRDTELQRERRKNPDLLKRKREADASDKRNRRENPDLRVDEQVRDTELRRKQRSQPEIRQKEREADASARRSRRENPDLRIDEQVRDTELQRERRKKPDILKRKREADASDKRNRRENPDLRVDEQVRDTELRRKRRSQPEIRQKEREADASARRSRRENPDLRIDEQVRDTELQRERRKKPDILKRKREADASDRRNRRENPDLRVDEQVRDTELQRKRRSKPDIQKKKRKADASDKRNRRENPDLRVDEQVRDTEARRRQRMIPDVRKKERAQNLRSMRHLRKNPKFRVEEQKKNTEAQRKRRQDQVVKARESLRNAEIMRRRRLSTDAVASFLDAVKQFPVHTCCCCGGLFYKHYVCSVDFTKVPADIKEEVVCVLTTPLLFCLNCNEHIKKGRIPTLALSNGFAFPEIPLELQNLSPLEERLVSPKLLFMQLKFLGTEQQRGIKGNVINVPNDLDKCAEVLPRRFNDASTIQVKLMRKMSYKVPYMYETIRPYNVYKAAKYLVETELYKTEGIKLSNDWNRFQEGDTLEFVTGNENDDVDEEASEQADQSSSESSEDEGDTNEVRLTETLLLPPEESQFRGKIIAPGEENTPIPLYRDRYVEELAFPTIYCGQPRIFKENLNVSYTKIATSEVRRYDPRGRKIQKLFFNFCRSFMEKVQSAVQVYLRKKITNRSITASQLKTPGFIDGLVGRDEGYAVFKTVRSTPSYWQQKSKNLLSMLRQLGPCSFFVTLSAAETKDIDLHVVLAKLNQDIDLTDEEAKKLTFDEVTNLISSDPVTCMRHFDHRQKELFKHLIKAAKGIFAPYKYADHFTRLEFQKRGSPHTHSLYWLKDAPTYNANNANTEEIVEFIDKFITCRRDEDPKLQDLLPLQIHRHSKTCYVGQFNRKQCRFGFPRPPLPQTMVLHPLDSNLDPESRMAADVNYLQIRETLENYSRNAPEESFLGYIEKLGMTEADYIIALRSPLKQSAVFLKRKTNEIYINNYNKTLLLAWRANIDVQFVLNPFACARYVANYILKPDKGLSKMLRKAETDARRGNWSLKEKLAHYSRTLLRGTEISGQEAAAFLLQIHNTSTSRDSVFVNTSLPSERIKMLKNQTHLNELEDDSDDVFATSIIDYYIIRPFQLNDVCLAAFATKFKCVKAKPKGTEGIDYFSFSGRKVFIKRRAHTIILRFRNFSRIKDPENYFREQIMLFKPWRNEEADILQKNKEATFMSSLDEIEANSKEYYYNRFIDETSLREILDEVQAQHERFVRAEEPESDEEYDAYITESVFKEKSTAGTSGSFMPSRLIEDDEYLVLMRSLNDKQRQFVYSVLRELKSEIKPLYYFLSGGAGVGKSHVIFAIVQSFLRFCSKQVSLTPDDMCVVISAFTGKAAWNVLGQTLHSIFHLNPTQSNQPLHQLESGVANSLRVKLRHVKLFIIDEISMVSVKMLYDIDKRLREIFQTDEDFGGKSVLVVGHLRQLPPVPPVYVFEKPNHLTLPNLAGNYLWEKFKIFELDQVMRQRDDLAFCKALNNMSEGVMDNDDIALLRSCEISPDRIPPDNVTWLFAENKECQAHNLRFHSTLDTDGCLAIARDVVEGSGSSQQVNYLLEQAKTYSASESNGLPYQTFLKVSATYFVSTNIDVQDGLFNGATGIIKQIDYSTYDNQRVPKAVWMEFSNRMIGSSCRAKTKDYQMAKNLPDHWVKITRCTRELKKRKDQAKSNLQVVRTQFPLVAANGMTVHKSQGSTMPMVVVSVSPEKVKKHGLYRQLLYVACSRATSKEHLYIHGKFVPPLKPTANDKVTKAMAEIRKQPVDIPFLLFHMMDACFEKICVHNINSIKNKVVDLESDHCVMSSTILALLEPRLVSTDSLSVSDYNVLLREDSRNRNSEGIVVLAKHGARNFQVEYKPYVDQTNRSHCFLCILSSENNSLKIVVLYKSPGYSKLKFLEHLKTTLEDLRGFHVIVTGDFNINFLTPDSATTISLFESYGFQKCIQDPTTDLGSQIDQCFANVANVQANVYETYFSDHKPILIAVPK